MYGNFRRREIVRVYCGAKPSRSIETNMTTMQSFREVSALERGPVPRGGHRGHHYRGTSLIRNIPLLGPSSRTIPRVLGWSWGGGAISYERGTPVGITCRGEKQEFRIGKIIFRAVVRRCGPSVWGLRTIGRRMLSTGLYEVSLRSTPRGSPTRTRWELQREKSSRNAIMPDRRH